jgi:glutathione S-transferase
MTIQLFGTKTSPYVRHCRIALIEGGLDFELVETDYARSARMTPTRRVPFMSDGETELRDSLSILRHVRDRSGRSFFPDVQDLDLFAMVNTALDTAVNLFLLEKDGITPAQSPYLERQAGRLSDLLDSFERRIGGLSFEPTAATDGQIRLGCFLAWGLFRERFSLSAHSELTRFLKAFGEYRIFTETAPRVN